VRIESNLAEVISRLRQHQADIPVAIERTLQPDTWIELAKQSAEKVILALAQPKERAYVPDFVRAVTAVAFNGLLLTLDAPAYTRVAAQMNLPGVSTGTFGPLSIPNQDLIAFEQLVQEWVETEKRWDVERDGPKNELTVYEKAQWVSYILLAPNLSTVALDPKRGSEQEARDALLPHVLAFIQKQQQKAGLAPETADLWLRAVLLQWTALVQAEFPIRLRATLDQMRRKKQKALL
jgi:hypothetical protein